jgi:esterase/lipase
MTTNGNTPDTIVLIHGFWVTPRSWEDWIAYYENKGYRVLAPAYPGFEVEVEALNADRPRSRRSRFRRSSSASSR